MGIGKSEPVVDSARNTRAADAFFPWESAASVDEFRNEFLPRQVLKPDRALTDSFQAAEVLRLESKLVRFSD